MNEMIKKVTKLIEILWEKDVSFIATWTGKCFMFTIVKEKANA